MAKTLKDFEDDGFTIYSPEDLAGNPSTPKGVTSTDTKIVVVDTKEVLHAVEQTNASFKAGIEQSNRMFQGGIERLVQAMASKHADRPEKFTLDIKRDQRGFMTSIDVRITK